ncbi:MAG: UDP-2,3-diacylglucosamine diphosphatase [Woeseiaceae bacterium]|jgi:UDP-2,3-diacylglucosamine hydrolase|nr:UDP-2,3-diacylglucosamine diphosphatase [Woeseiaceae bacterium]
MTTLFISDLHLEANRPEIGKQFLSFLDGEARDAEALYILGDLFEIWLGDDDPNLYYTGIKVAIRRLTDSGVPVFFMHGNRDFLIGKIFSNETGVEILNDPVIVDLYGQSVLLSHGDTLCTDDIQYQKIRTMTRNPDWQAMMLAKSLEERIAFSVQARKDSMTHNSSVGAEIMDVNLEAVVSMLRKFGTSIMLHGHTHRPDIHNIDLGNQLATRIVLGDWFEQGSVVRWDENGPRLEVMIR